MKLLFENQSLIVCIKPAGLIVQPGQGESLCDALEAYLRQKGEIGAVYLIHRLDRDVGGVMVFAKSHAAASFLSAAMEQHRIHKEYLAVIHGCPAQDEARWEDFLWRDPNSQLTRVVSATHKGAKAASLSYRVLSQNRDLTLVRVRLYTGRTHQIRVQFASRGLPLVGDEKYGLPDESGIALWSCALSIPDPDGGKPLHFFAPPCGLPWERFTLPQQ